MPHFLDIEICPSGLGIYHKNTQTGQYKNIESFTLWKWKTSWITSLTIRAKRICSKYHLNQEINLIKDYAAWNGFPKRTANSIIKRALQANNSKTTRSKKANADSVKIFFNLNYSGETAERMVKSCIKKLYRRFKREINVTYYKTTKMLFFTNTKDKTPSLSQSSIVYQFTCSGCSCNHIGKTERTLHEKTEEHGYSNKKSNEQSAIYEHLPTCHHYCHIVDLFNVNNHDVNSSKLDTNQIRGNTIVLDKADNWNELLFKEALLIKSHKPSLNTGLKASKELQLF